MACSLFRRSGFASASLAAVTALLLGGAISRPAHADPLPSNSQLLSGFDLILNNTGNSTNTTAYKSSAYTTPHDDDGAVLIGGNSAGISSGAGSANPTVPNGFGYINIYGNATGDYKTNGAVYVQGSTSGATFDNETSINRQLPYAFSSIYNQLTSLSTSLSHLTGTTLTATSNIQLSAPASTTVNGVAGVSVLNITGSQLESLTPNGPQLSLNGAKLLIINVDTADTNGSVATPQGVNFNLSAAQDSAIIWNFYDATGTISFATEIGGVILAPNAVYNGSRIDGTLVAVNSAVDVETHYQPLSCIGDTFVDSFNHGGNDCAPSGGGTPGTPVPEPSSLALLGAGLAALPALRRLRRAR